VEAVNEFSVAQDGTAIGKVALRERVKGETRVVVFRLDQNHLMRAADRCRYTVLDHHVGIQPSDVDNKQVGRRDVTPDVVMNSF
jgi:hypothetical protein